MIFRNHSHQGAVGVIMINLLNNSVLIQYNAIMLTWHITKSLE